MPSLEPGRRELVGAHPRRLQMVSVILCIPASVTSVTIPAEFLEPGTEYKLEVQAIEKSGNQTISEISFRVG